MAKIYNLTERLQFNDDPVLTIKGTELTVKSDAESVLQLIDVYASKGGLAAAREAEKLLFSAADQKKLHSLKLKAEDYMTTVQAAMQLAIGTDPDEESSGE